MFSPPGRPSPAQLTSWLADGREALKIAAQPLRLWNVFARGHTTPTQNQSLIHRLISTGTTKLRSISSWLADNAATGKATLDAWFHGFAGAMAPTLFAAGMAILGTADLAPADVRAADEQVAEQYGWLGRFRNQLRDGSQALWTPVATGPANPGGIAGASPLLGGQRLPRDPAGSLLSRSGMYADAAWSVAQNVMGARMARDGYELELAILGGARKHCSGCLDRAGMGWQPIGTLPRIGSTPCRGNCRCHFTYANRADLAKTTQVTFAQPSTPGRPISAQHELKLSAPAAPSKPPLPSLASPPLPMSAVKSSGTKLPSFQAAGSSGPLLPDRPMAERIKAYAATTGNAKLKGVRAAIEGAANEAKKLGIARVKATGELRDVMKQLHASDVADPALKARRIDLLNHIQSIDDKIKSPMTLVRERINRVLAVDDHATFGTESAPWRLHEHLTDQAKGQVKEGTDFLTGIVRKGDQGHIPTKYAMIPKDMPQRAAASKSGYVQIGHWAESSTVVHEAGHVVETTITTKGRSLFESSKEFLEHRVGAEPFQPLRKLFGRQFGAKEMGRKDKFDEVFGKEGGFYVGKVYGDGSEVISMGLEKLHRDPMALIEKDPNLSHFLFGILDGSLR